MEERKGEKEEEQEEEEEKQKGKGEQKKAHKREKDHGWKKKMGKNLKGVTERDKAKTQGGSAEERKSGWGKRASPVLTEVGADS